MRDLGTKASGAAEARIVGNLAGVVEWANDAFARLSGIGLDETLDKPVGRLLERAGIDLEIVEFVAQHFFEGGVCRVAFPFERPDGRRIDVLLEVEALRDAVGEIDRFMAIAREAVPTAADATAPTGNGTETLSAIDAAAPHAGAGARARTSTSPSGASTGITASPRPAVDLTAAIRRGVESALAVRRDERRDGATDGSRGSASDESNASPPELDFTFELDLAEGLEPVEVAGPFWIDAAVEDGTRDESGGGGGDDRARPATDAVEALVKALVEAARQGIAETGNAGGAITLSTARLAPQRRFVSRVHAIATCPAERSASGDVVLEIHDTGRALPNPVVAALGRGDFVGACSLDPGARVRALAEGCARALALGARIHLDSTPGCGSQLLVLFAPSATPARTLRAAPASAPAQAQAQAQAR